MRYQYLKITRTIVRFIVPLTPLLIAGILVSGAIRIPDFIRDASVTVASPFWSFKNIFLRKCDSLEYDTDPVLLRAQYSIDALKKDNERLRTLLGRGNKSHSIGASILHNGTTAPYDTFTIDVGEHDGIREGMLITIPDNIAIGYVESPYPRTSTGSLFSAPNNKFMGIFSGTSTVHVEITGHGGGTMRATLPRDVEVAVEDTVTLPGFETYVIGTVASIEVAPEDAFKIVYIRTPQNISTIRFVHIDTTHVWSDVFTQPPEEVAP